VKKYKNRDRKRGREIAVDCASLYGAIKSIGETNGHICALCGFGHAYLSDVKRRGWMYESDIEKLSDAGIDAADYVTDEWYRAKYLKEDEPVKLAEPITVLEAVGELNPPPKLVAIELTEQLLGFCQFVDEQPQTEVEIAIRQFLANQREILWRGRES
jgi:hypothetical protein